MREMEAFAEETAVEFKKAVEEGLVRYQEEVKERRLQDDTIEKAPIHSEKVVIEEKKEVSLGEIDSGAPIFVKEDGKLIGMVIKNKKGWIVMTGGASGSFGYRKTREECIEYGMEEMGYEFFIES